jgi:type IV secretory pathway VirB2 component (pilin)
MKIKIILVIFFILVSANDAFASSISMPWDTPLDTLVGYLNSKFTVAVSSVIAVLLGVTIGTGHAGGGWLKMVTYAVFGISIMFGGVGLVTQWFGVGSGLTM